jgi:hypothetical protein
VRSNGAIALGAAEGQCDAALRCFPGARG